MKLLLDECVPQRLSKDLPDHEVLTADEVGLRGVRNGELLRTAAEEFDVLITEKKRLFQAQRYCYLGAIDDWIDIGTTGSLASLAKRYIKHLGRESYFELI